MNFHKEFASRHAISFLEMLLEGGCSGGLYGDVITVIEGQEGVFDASTIQKYIRFQHIHNEHCHDFGRLADQELQEDSQATAQAILDELSASEGFEALQGRMPPAFEEQARASLKAIIEA